MKRVAALVLVSSIAACSSADPASDDGPPTTGSTQDAGVPDGAANPGPVATADAHASDAPAAIAATPAGCGAYAGETSFVCAADGNARGKCVQNASVIEQCPRGCLRKSGEDSTCMGTTSSFSCTGSYGKTKAEDGDYYITAFGCWKDENGVVHGGSGDNCIPTCLSQAKAKGLCDAGDTGKQCEERVTWYTADGARFGCGARLRVTNPENGKSVIAVALDYGPACWVEDNVSKTVLDASGRINRYLFGADMGATDHGLVHVVEVDDSFPLGPVP
jgi:hypothetical protein